MRRDPKEYGSNSFGYKLNKHLDDEQKRKDKPWYPKRKKEEENVPDVLGD